MLTRKIRPFSSGSLLRKAGQRAADHCRRAIRLCSGCIHSRPMALAACAGQDLQTVLCDVDKFSAYLVRREQLESTLPGERPTDSGPTNHLSRPPSRSYTNVAFHGERKLLYSQACVVRSTSKLAGMVTVPRGSPTLAQSILLHPMTFPMFSPAAAKKGSAITAVYLRPPRSSDLRPNNPAGVQHKVIANSRCLFCSWKSR